VDIICIASRADALHDRNFLSSLTLCIILAKLTHEVVIGVLRILFKLVLGMVTLIPSVEELVEFLKLGRRLCGINNV